MDTICKKGEIKKYTSEHQELYELNNRRQQVREEERGVTWSGKAAGL